MNLLIFTACLFILGRRVYKNRELFKSLTKREWLQYAVSVSSALAVAMGLIFSSSKLLALYDVGVMRPVIAIVVILVALGLVNIVMKKLLPEKLKAFYS